MTFPSHSPSSSALQSLSLHQGVAADSTLMEDNPFAPVDNHPFINVFALEESPYVSQTLHHLGKWSNDHLLDTIIGNPSRPVSTRIQLEIDAFWCLFIPLSTVKDETKILQICNYLRLFSLCIVIIATQVIYKVKNLIESGDVLKNKARYADHAGCQGHSKEYAGSAQFLGDKLVSWSSKKQKSTVISTTEEEYIVMSGCCAQIL
ncbi:hypothetical protein Tco_1120856 [Tanacetum coccineum]|uniref:Uncharacterized protein n=1 Tax=Tanacetum coccineum TaxID=301880 RepID=A0ABQ5IWE9_9ASTR